MRKYTIELQEVAGCELEFSDTFVIISNYEWGRPQVNRAGMHRQTAVKVAQAILDEAGIPYGHRQSEVI